MPHHITYLMRVFSSVLRVIHFIKTHDVRVWRGGPNFLTFLGSVSVPSTSNRAMTSLFAIYNKLAIFVDWTPLPQSQYPT